MNRSTITDQRSPQNRATIEYSCTQVLSSPARCRLVAGPSGENNKMDGQQGGRVASGLGPIGMMTALTTLFRPLVKAPVSAYLEAMRCIDAAAVIPDLMEFAEITFDTAEDQRHFGALRDDPLPVDGIAFLMSYSAEATHPPLYKDMNDKCYDADRSKIAPYGPYVVATVKYMAQLRPYPNDTVFRGVKADLRADYPEGRRVIWHGFCSTTKSAAVLSNPQFCGDSGKRTIFTIKLTQGQARDITRYSLVAAEGEVLLPPGCRFQVESVLPQGDDLTLIQLRELPSKEWILDLRTAGAAAGAGGAGVAGAGGGGAVYASNAERLALLQQKIEQKTATLECLQAMGQTGKAVVDLHREVCTVSGSSFFLSQNLCTRTTM